MQEAAAVGVDLADRAVEHVLHHVEVVGGEVDRDAGVLDPRGQRPDPGGVGAVDAGRAARRRPGSRSLAIAGLKRSTWPTISLRSASSAAPRIRSASGRVVAIGFSTSTCRPAASASSATSAWHLRRTGDRDGVELVGAELDQVAPVVVFDDLASRRGPACATAGEGRRRRPAGRSRAASSCGRGSRPSRPQPMTPTRSCSDIGSPPIGSARAVSDGRVGDLAAAALPSPKIGGRSLRARLRQRRRGTASASAPTRVFQPVETVSIHSVSSRIVTQGTPQR